MRFVRGLLRWLSSIFLHTALLLFIMSIAFTTIFGNDQVTKDALLESDVYNQFVPALLNDTIKANEGKRSSLPFDDPQIQNIAYESFAPKDLKAKTEYLVDSIFGWLDGTEPKLEFSVNLSDQKAKFIESVSTYAATRLGSLPDCTQVDLGNVTVFDLNCRPENVPLSFVKQKVADDLNNSEFLAKVSLTEQDLPRAESGKLLQEQYSFAPRLYRVAKSGVWFSSMLFLLAATLFVIVRRPIRKGVRTIGRDLFSSAATFMVMTFIFGFILPRYTNSFTIQGGESMKLFNSVINVFVKRFDIILINVSLQIFAVAVIIVVIERLSRSTSIYAGINKKSGLMTSLGNKKSNEVRSKLPPVQTSEIKKRVKKRKKSLSKYRKMGL